MYIWALDNARLNIVLLKIVCIHHHTQTPLKDIDQPANLHKASLVWASVQQLNANLDLFCPLCTFVPFSMTIHQCIY